MSCNNKHILTRPTRRTLRYTIVNIITLLDHAPCQVEVTKFEELEEAHADVKMKKNLWDAQSDWDALYEEWMMVRE